MMNPAEFAHIAESEQKFWWYRGMREILFGLLDPLISARRIANGIDAGCGTGYLAKLVEQRYEFPMTGIDYGYEGLQFGQRLGLKRLAQADVRALPFTSESFGLVLSMDVIVHFERGQEGLAIREMARILSRAGLLVIRVSALDVLHSRHSTFTHERQRFTKRRLIEAVQAQDLKVLRCTYLNSLLLPIALAKFRIWEPLTKQAPASGVAPAPPWLDRTLHLPLAVESRVTKLGVNLPVGQSLLLIAEKQGV